MGYLSSPKETMISVSTLTHSYPAPFTPTQVELARPWPHIPADQGRRSNSTPLAEPGLR